MAVGAVPDSPQENPPLPCHLDVDGADRLPVIGVDTPLVHLAGDHVQRDAHATDVAGPVAEELRVEEALGYAAEQSDT